MAETPTIETVKEAEMKKQLEKIDWTIDYGNVKIQVRAGKATMVTLEKTIRLD